MRSHIAVFHHRNLEVFGLPNPVHVVIDRRLQLLLVPDRVVTVEEVK
jgi:hypothetical protein